ncbi:MAG: hypothetical protein Q7W29_01085 [bacterium]|nr:hypothetical protein [bacterium]
MNRWPILLPCFLLSATTAAVAGEFPFAARVEVLPSVSVRDEADGPVPAFRLTTPQDQCLNVAWRRAGGGSVAPIAAVLRTDGEPTHLVEPPAGDGTWILVVTLE